MNLKNKWFYWVACLFTVSLLVGCASGPKIGQLDSGDVYTLNVPGQYPATVSAYIPVAAYPYMDPNWLRVNEEVVDNEWASASFFAMYQYYNAVNFQILSQAYSQYMGPNASFKDFQNAFKQAVLNDYGNDDVIIKLVHEEKTTFHGRPAIYNVYTIMPKQQSSLKTAITGEYHPVIVMQYIVDYQHHWANIEFIASTFEFHQDEIIKGPKQAINREYPDANQFFDSFNLRYGE